MTEEMKYLLADSRSLAPELRALLIRHAALGLLIDHDAIEGGDPDAVANAELVGAELRIVRGRIGAYLAAVEEGRSALHAAK
jgi:hypothetical protein